MRIVVLVLGILGVLLGLLVTIVSLAMPVLQPNNVKYSEIAPAIIGGIIILIFSLVIAIIGLVLVIKRKKQN